MACAVTTFGAARTGRGKKVGRLLPRARSAARLLVTDMKQPTGRGDDLHWRRSAEAALRTSAVGEENGKRA